VARNNPTVTLTFAGDSKQLTRASDDVGDATDKMRDTIDKNSTSMSRDTSKSTLEQARSLGDRRQQYDRTANSFADMVDRMIKDKRRLDRLAKDADTLGVKEHPVFGLVYKQPAHDSGDSAGDAFADGFNSSASKGIKGFMNAPMAIVGAAALVSSFGPVGLAIGGAVVTGFGVAIAGLGLKVAAESPEVIARFERLTTNIKAKMMQISKPFEQTLIDIASASQQVFNKIAPELDKAFPQAAKDITAFIFQLQEGFKQLAPVIGPIMDAFGDILDSIGPQLPGVFQNIANALIPLAETISENSDGFATIVIFMLNLIPVAINLITAMIEFGMWWAAVWRGAWEAVSDAYNNISAFGQSIMDFIGRVGSFIGGIFGQMKEAMVTRFREMLQGVRDWPSTIKAAIGDLGRILWDAGARLVGGLIDGIKSKFREVMNTLRDLTAVLPSWKGPVEVDAKLLTGNGRLIIDSLLTGFRQEEPNVKSYLNDLTGFIGGFGPDQPRLTGSSSGTARSEPRRVTFGSDGTALGDATLDIVLNALRRAGGDTKALGV